MLPRKDQVGDVGHRRRNPAPTLVEELDEVFRCLSVRVGSGAVLDPIARLQQERAEPAVFPWIRTKKTDGFIVMSTDDDDD